MKILVGDLGGTHTRLALAEPGANPIGSGIHLSPVARYLNSEHANLSAILRQFLEQSSASANLACCLAVAGPTNGKHVQFTNLNWCIDTDELTQHFGFSKCRLLNDFAAVGWGLNTLTPAMLEPLQTGEPVAGDAHGAAVALGAGTGFGVSLCSWHSNHYQPLASEGGHVGFAPRNSEQDRLLVFLRTLYNRVSVERILSGPGLVDLFRFCLREAGKTYSPLLETTHPAEAISQAGLAQNDAGATHALHLFAEIYGQTAGDWALATQASGGIFLAGGIAPKLLPILKNSIFLDGFNAKGRYSDWMMRVPVAVILDPDIGLKGAAFAAATTGAK